MLYVLYTDASGNERYELIGRAYSDSIRDKWQASHPDCKLTAMFDAADDKILSGHKEYSDFCLLCKEYGFDISDYRRKVRTGPGETGELIGFKPANRKYKCIIRMADRTHNIKATVGYVRDSLLDQP